MQQNVAMKSANNTKHKTGTFTFFHPSKAQRKRMSKNTEQETQNNTV